MSGKDGIPGSSRRKFGIILGGLGAGAILGATGMAHADDSKGSGSTASTETDAHGARPGSGDVRQIGRSDIDGLAAKLDAVTLSDNERALLVGLLSLAVDTIGRSRTGSPVSPLVSTASGAKGLIGVKTQGHLPSIRDQFSKAFTPGSIRDRAVDEPAKVVGVE